MVKETFREHLTAKATERGLNGENEKIKRCPKSLTVDNMNPYIKTFKKMEYAARGPVIIRAMQLEQQIAQGTANKGFSEVIKANLGDAMAMGQRPITFLRQVMALVTCPDIIDSCGFNNDIKQKARDILRQCRGESAGSYSDSRGMEIVRRHVAEYIEKRDGDNFSCSPDDIIICAGASDGIRSCLKLFKHLEGATQSGVLVPCPEYPLYSATLGEYNIRQINYFLDEETNWSILTQELEHSIAEAQKTCKPRAIVVINPGNPTGHVLSRSNIEEVIKFAYKHKLVILADEVYQDNIYGNAEFFSFRKVLNNMPPPFNQVELISFYSCSKGYICECGLRGAYFETLNIDQQVKSVLTATQAAKLCPTVLGQVAVDCAVNPPKEGDTSYPQYKQQRDTILNSLAEKAELLTQEFNSIPGVSCSKISGAMYAFPKIEIPQLAIQASKALGEEADVFYALELLEETGICVVPGSGIGQRNGTFHFRTTILPPIEQLREMMVKFRSFHENFLSRYS